MWADRGKLKVATSSISITAPDGNKFHLNGRRMQFLDGGKEIVWYSKGERYYFKKGTKPFERLTAKIAEESAVQQRKADAEAFTRIQEELNACEVSFAKGDIKAAQFHLDKATKLLEPHNRRKPTPEGLKPVQTRYADKKAKIEAASRALELFDKATKLKAEADGLIRESRFLDADRRLEKAVAALEQISDHDAKRADRTKLMSAIQATRKQIQSQAAQQRKAEEKREAENKRAELKAQAMRELCGDKPARDAWDGDIIGIESWLERTAHDPDSIDVENCTDPVMTDNCWRTRCLVRGKNAFGAMVATNKTFYMGRNPNARNLHTVIKMED